MKITVLDADTLGKDLDLSPLFEVGEAEFYPQTTCDDLPERILESEVVIINKVKLNEKTLCGANKLKLICVAATGYDNVDIEYCNRMGIRVCNVVGYSTHSVAQVTLASVLSLATHLREYTDAVSTGEYTRAGIPNRVSPPFYELRGKTWGVVGLGNIGRRVAEIASAFGCKVIAYKRTPVEDIECVGLSELCQRSDIISLHTPLSDATRALIGRDAISHMKPGVILYNAARGAVTDEAEVARAVKEGRIGAFGCDVYSLEPLSADNPIYSIKDLPNVCLTPHMAWASFEARSLCLSEIIENIRAFYRGERRCAVTRV